MENLEDKIKLLTEQNEELSSRVECLQEEIADIITRLERAVSKKVTLGEVGQLLEDVVYIYKIYK